MQNEDVIRPSLHRPNRLAKLQMLYAEAPINGRVSAVTLGRLSRYRSSFRCVDVGIMMINHYRQSLSAAWKDGTRAFQIEFPGSREIGALSRRSNLSGQQQ
jgi:hypothetical protein